MSEREVRILERKFKGDTSHFELKVKTRGYFEVYAKIYNRETGYQSPSVIVRLNNNKLENVPIEFIEFI